MYFFRNLLIGSIVFLSIAGYAAPSRSLAAKEIGERGSFGASNEMYSGNRENVGGMANSNKMYSGNSADNTAGQSNRMYSGNMNDNRGVDNGLGYYNAAPIEPVMPAYGYGYYGAPPPPTNSQVFPDDAQANSLYWNEVNQMENGQ